MKTLLFYANLLAFCFAANAQINLNGLKSKLLKSDSTNTTTNTTSKAPVGGNYPGMEVLFSNKLNPDGSKNGIEFKNEFNLNEDLFISYYFNKKIEKFSQWGVFDVRLFIEPTIDFSKLDAKQVFALKYDGALNYNEAVEFNMFQDGLNYSKPWTRANKENPYLTPEQIKQREAEFWIKVSNHPKNRVKIKVIVVREATNWNQRNKEKCYETEFYINKKPGEKFIFNSKYERLPETNKDEAMKKRFFALWNEANASQDTANVVDLRITEKTWTTMRNDKGVIFYRNIYGFIKLKYKSGYCGISKQEFREEYDGQKYQEESLKNYWTPLQGNAAGKYIEYCDCK